MDPGKPLPMTPFDSLTSSGELQMLKLLLPYTPPSVQRMLAFFIRFTELQRAVRYFSVFRDFREGADPEGAFASTPPPHLRSCRICGLIWTGRQTRWI